MNAASIFFPSVSGVLQFSKSSSDLDGRIFTRCEKTSPPTSFDAIWKHRRGVLTFALNRTRLHGHFARCVVGRDCEFRGGIRDWQSATRLPFASLPRFGWDDNRPPRNLLGRGCWARTSFDAYNEKPRRALEQAGWMWTTFQRPDQLPAAGASGVGSTPGSGGFSPPALGSAPSSAAGSPSTAAFLDSAASCFIFSSSA